MGFLSNIGGLMLPGFPGTSTDPAKLFDRGGGGGGDNNSANYPMAEFASSGTGQLTAYEPNYETFYNPLAMLQSGQPSFSDPTWYTSMLGPAQQQNMLAAAPPQAQAPAMPENPWSPGGQNYQSVQSLGAPLAGIGSPESLSNIQHEYTGRYPSPWAMQLMMQGRENSG